MRYCICVVFLIKNVYSILINIPDYQDLLIVLGDNYLLTTLADLMQP